MPTPRGAYSWDAKSGRYRGSNGRYVSGAAVRAELDASIDASAAAIRQASDALRAGQLSLSEWELVMATEIRNSHLASVALAKGGWAQLTRGDELRAAQAIRAQYAYLQRFAAQIASGKQKLDGTLARRAELYVNSARAAYEETRKREMEKRGMSEERRVRHARDSCGTCVTEAGRGWQPIGTLRAIGDSECLYRCKCTFDYRVSEEAAA